MTTLRTQAEAIARAVLNAYHRALPRPCNNTPDDLAGAVGAATDVAMVELGRLERARELAEQPVSERPAFKSRHPMIGGSTPDDTVTRTCAAWCGSVHPRGGSSARMCTIHLGDVCYCTEACRQAGRALHPHVDPFGATPARGTKRRP